MNNASILKMVIVCSVLFLTIQCTPTKNVTENVSTTWIDGKWEGVGYQLNTSGTWLIKLDIKNSNYFIAYPSLECSGKWQVQKQSANKIEFIETITKGTDKCVNKGRIVITKVDENHISYTYFSPYSGELEAFSTLVRKSHLDKSKIRS